MYLLLLWIAKGIQYASRMSGNSGAAAPGLFIERLWPQFLEKGLEKLPDGVVVVSGTNGKTTTTKLIADVLHANGKRTLTNRTGSNMTRGLISLLVAKSSLFGRLPYDIAILEVDEAYAAVLAKRLPIRGAVLLNVMRDQLDRFGEIDSTAKHLAALSRRATDFVVLNANDPRVKDLPSSANKVMFGAHSSLSNLLVNDDDWHSQDKRSTLKITADYMLEASNDQTIKLRHSKQRHTLEVRVRGVHNHLNLVAAWATLEQLIAPSHVSSQGLLAALSEVEPAFGRGEWVRLGESAVQLLLVKNPSSFAQTVRTAPIEEVRSVVIVINDAYADSRDVSWLWDVDVAVFGRASELATAGTRGADMAVRLKYSDIAVKTVYPSLQTLLKHIQTEQGNHLIFCTYTAMLDIRKMLVKQGHTRQIT